jgi:vitamin K-dependent gamma-carboxylase
MERNTFLNRMWRRGQEPVDAASLAVFRIALGLLIIYDALRKGDHFFGSNNLAHFRFTYDGFAWVPSAGAWAPYLADLWLFCAVLVVLGLFYRPAIIVTTLLTIFGFLQAREYYLNHYYLLIIVCFLMCLVPANRAYALDCLWGKGKRTPPVVSRMHMWLLKGQTEIVLIYAGLVKINADWLQLEPLRSWLLQRREEVFYGWLWNYDWAVAVGAYGIIILHILGAPLLMWKRTRLAIFLVYCSFHLTNHFIFNIGIFPWMTIAMSALFFPTDWPRKIAAKLRGIAGIVASGTGQARDAASNALAAQPFPSGWRAGAFASFACVWLVFQSVYPLRHYLYEGDVAWTREGHAFAWRMKLIDRWSPGMYAVAYLPEKRLLLVPPLRNLLTSRQYRKTTTRPRMAQILAPQLAAMIGETYKVKKVQVKFYYPVGYNNREATLLIDPKVDLVTARVDQIPAPWIIKENDKPLRRVEEFSRKYDFPILQDMTAMMQLPKPAGCKFLKNKWIVCHAVKNPHLSSLR